MKDYKVDSERDTHVKFQHTCIYRVQMVHLRPILCLQVNFGLNCDAGSSPACEPDYSVDITPSL